MKGKTFMGQVIEGELSARGKRFAVVGARWTSIFSERLIEGALDAFVRHGADERELTIVRVPGSFEIPLVCRELALSKKFHGVVGVGTLIRGETDHYQLIAGELTGGLQRAMVDSGVPVAFGVITADTMEQAMARSGAKAGNKGFEAAVAAIELANVLEKIRRLPG